MRSKPPGPKPSPHLVGMPSITHQPSPSEERFPLRILWRFYGIIAPTKFTNVPSYSTLRKSLTGGVPNSAFNPWYFKKNKEEVHIAYMPFLSLYIHRQKYRYREVSLVRSWSLSSLGVHYRRTCGVFTHVEPPSAYALLPSTTQAASPPSIPKRKWPKDDQAPIQVSS